MTLNINIAAEMEKTLHHRATATGKDVETLVTEYIVERLGEDSPAPQKATSHEEFMTKLQRFIDLHPASPGWIDDSRESIYAGRGE